MAITKEESEGVRLTAAERQEINVVIPEIRPTNEAEGDFILCEIEEQQAARVSKYRAHKEEQ